MTDPTQELLPPRRPRFVFTRRQAGLFTAGSYLLAVLLAGLELHLWAEGTPEEKLFALTIFAVVLAIPFGIAARNITRKW